MTGRLALWSRQMRLYRGEAKTWRDLGKLMRVRLSQSKVGPWFTPRPIVVAVDLNSLGDGIHLRSHSTDTSVLHELILGGSLASAPRALGTQTVVDLGANNGLAFRWLAGRYPRADFVCVEPAADNCRILEANVRTSGRDCMVVQAGIGADSRTGHLDVSGDQWAYRLSEAPGDATVAVNVISMPDLLQAAGIERIGLLKCDIEGAERELFADCRAWIDRVEHLAIECHRDSLNGEELMAMLRENGARPRITASVDNASYGCELLGIDFDA
jgi:FkbM family methyltransferase